MKLFGTLSCVFGSALALFAITTGFMPKFESMDSMMAKRKATTPGAGSFKDQADVIVINEERRIPMLRGGGGYGADWISCQALKDGEEQYRLGNYDAAARNFNFMLQLNPKDIRSQLGLGKTYVSLHKFQEAIYYLSKVRNECLRASSRKGSASPENDSFHMCTINFSNLDNLPEQACRSIDHEARQALESAVTGAIKPRLPDSPSVSEYKNDRHFQVLNASLQLAKKYHDKSQLEQLKAMYLLAQENTRTLPVELVTDCTIKSKGVDEQWQELSRLMLNSAVKEEKEWYLKRLAVALDALPDADIKKLALNHVFYSRDKNDAVALDYLRDAKTIKTMLYRQPGNYALMFANAAFNHGLQAFRSQYQFKEAREFFLIALSIYNLDGTAKDVSDTQYCLGIVSYELGDSLEAKRYFKQASNLRKGKTKFERNEMKAAFNYGILAVDSPPTKDAEEFLFLFAKQTQHPDAAALLGLYNLRHDNLEGAYAPLKAACEANDSANDNYVSSNPRQTEATADLRPQHKDRTFTDHQVLSFMFERDDAIKETVFSRFAAEYFDVDENNISTTVSGTDLYRLSPDALPELKYTVKSLYPALLRKTHRESEFREFKKNSIRPGYYKVTTKAPKERSEQSVYRSLISTTLHNTWYAPKHFGPQEIIVRVKVTKDGILEPILPLELQFPYDKQDVFSDSIAESIEWAALPPPPPGYVGKEIILVYNASSTIGPTSIHPLLLKPMNTLGTEW